MKMAYLQSVGRASWFTRLDFRPKLLLMAVVTGLAFLWESPALGWLLAASVIAACLAAGVKADYLRRVVTLMFPFYLFIIVTQGFFAGPLIAARTGKTAAELTLLFRFPATWGWLGGAGMSWEGVLYALNIIAKTLTMTLVIPLAVFTTDVNTLIVGLVKAGLPYKLAFIFSSTLRFFPLLFEEIHTIIEAQRLRGLAFERMNPLKRARVYATIVVPLILGALVKSQTLEIVLQSKAFSGSADRTYLHETRLGAGDYVLVVFLILLLIGALVAYFGWGVGRFGGPL